MNCVRAATGGVYEQPRMRGDRIGQIPCYRDQVSSKDAARELLKVGIKGKRSMSVVRILGFSTLSCGCVVGRYRDVASTREVVYVEEKGVGCESHAHRRNHTVSAERERFAAVGTTLTARAS